MSSLHVAGMGEVLWDIYPDARYPGGAPANFAGHIAQYGINSYLISRVGQDRAGKELLEEMQKLGIQTDMVQTDSKYPTGTVNVSIDAHGSPAFQCTTNVAFDHIQWIKSLESMTTSLDGVLFGTLAQRNADSRTTIQQYISEMYLTVKLFDVNIRVWDEDVKKVVLKSLELADIIKMNDQELLTLKTALQAESGNDCDFLHMLIKEYRVALAAVTRGAQGCLLVTKAQKTEHPGYQVNAVDTTGCGDAFAAGLMISVLEKRSLEETAELANRLGAFVATRRGAVPSWTLKDLYAYE